MQFFCKPYGKIAKIAFSTENPTGVNIKVNCSAKQTVCHEKLLWRRTLETAHVHLMRITTYACQHHEAKDINTGVHVFIASPCHLHELFHTTASNGFLLRNWFYTSVQSFSRINPAWSQVQKHTSRQDQLKKPKNLQSGAEQPFPILK